MDQQTLFSLLVDLHRDGYRQGPGSDDETRRAFDLTRLDDTAALRIADIGCGTGASSLTLAKQLPNANITAVDLFSEFLEVLKQRSQDAGVAGRIKPVAESMESLPFGTESLDLIWSEGAIYNIGFGKGIETWRPFLRSGGVLAVSEITWLRPNPPAEIWEHWKSEYPEIGTACEKIQLLENAGYDLLGYFSLPSNCWTDNYFDPTEQRMPRFLERHSGVPEATEVAELERQEAELYRRYQDWFSYGFYVARKADRE